MSSGTRLFNLSISGNNYEFATLNSRLWGELRDSTRDIDEYSETSAFVSLVYGFGQVSRPGRRGGF